MVLQKCTDPKLKQTKMYGMKPTVSSRTVPSHQSVRVNFLLKNHRPVFV